MTFFDCFDDDPGPFGLLARPAWHRLAACRGSDPDIFYSERGERVAEAKRICAICQVADVCLESGICEHHGVWGGTSPRQRERMRAARKRAS